MQKLEEPEGSTFIRHHGILKNLRQDGSKNHRIHNNRLNINENVSKSICHIYSDDSDDQSEIEIINVHTKQPNKHKARNNNVNVTPGQGQVSQMIDEHNHYNRVRAKAHRALKDTSISPSSRKYYIRVRTGLINKEPNIQAAVDDEVTEAAESNVPFCSQDALQNIRPIIETP